MISNNYANAMKEVLHYLKGIRIEDVNKIPKKLINYLEENASKEYICDFDYRRPLKELNVTDEAKGIISFICYNYWCETKEEKKNFMKKLNENTIKYQEELKKKYNINVFEDANKKVEINLPNNKKESKICKIYKKILDFIKRKK